MGFHSPGREAIRFCMPKEAPSLRNFTAYCCHCLPRWGRATPSPTAQKAGGRGTPLRHTLLPRHAFSNTHLTTGKHPLPHHHTATTPYLYSWTGHAYTHTHCTWDTSYP